MTLNWRNNIRIGLILGVVVLVASAIGMVQKFDERSLIVGVLTLGQLLLYIPPLYGGFLTIIGEERHSPFSILLGGMVAGFFTSLPVIGLVFLATAWAGIRAYFPNISPALIEILTFDQGPVLGSLILAGVMTVLGGLGAAIHLIPVRIRRPIINALLVTLAISLFSEVPLNIANQFLVRDTVRFLFGTKGITIAAALITFTIALAVAVFWEWRGRETRQKRIAAQTPAELKRNQRITTVLMLLFLLILPRILGIFLTNVMAQVGTFALMALGLNIVVGFAGLLDLGYVAFFAVGAYVIGLLTSTGDLGMGMSFWMALPIAVVASTVTGIILGIPVLRLRGDYLAIVTLAFGEIIRVLVRSDLLKPVIGGAQGIINIARPTIGEFQFVTPQHFYYLILAGCILAWFIASRLRDGRLGRRWMAMREDEDVAEAVGINLVNTKLLAFAIGATFAGLAGAIFAARLSSVFPNSFELLISINTLAIVIVGGIGSLPGVVLGAFVLVGLPELLREFEEYRLLIYGILLIVMMLVRPEGIWPSAVTRREMHADEEDAAIIRAKPNETQPAA
jgi:branched-chain amino acid transport system permease protein